MSGGSIRRRIALGLAVLTASGLFSLVSSGTAEAAAVCSGRKARTLAFATGDVHVYRSDGYVCAMTVPKRQGRPPVDVGQRTGARRAARSSTGAASRTGRPGDRPRGTATAVIRRCRDRRRADPVAARRGCRIRLNLDPYLVPIRPGPACVRPKLRGPYSTCPRDFPISPGAPASCSDSFRRTAVSQGRVYAQGAQMAAGARGAHRHVEHGGGGHRRSAGGHRHQRTTSRRTSRTSSSRSRA